MHRLNCCGLLLVGLAVCAVAVSGCGKPAMDTDFVEGTVTLDGTPVAGATVTFQPVTAGQGVSATGMTDDSGKYKLTAVGAGAADAAAHAGTVPGEYYVGVVKVSFGNEELSEEEMAEQASGGGEETPTSDATHVVPQKYNIPSESGITVTVKEGSNDIPIELTSN